MTDFFQDTSFRTDPPPEPTHSHRPTLLLLLALLLLLLLGAGLYFAISQRIDQTNQALQDQKEQNAKDIKEGLVKVEVQTKPDDSQVSVDDNSTPSASGLQGASQTPAGADGASGLQGDQGVQGPAGTPGPTGTNGQTGSPGSTGLQGSTGPAGPSGTATCPNGDCLSLQATSPGTQETGSINISGDGLFGGDVNAANLSAGTVTGTTFFGDGTNVTNVDSITLQGQNGAFYRNASNINAGTLADARLSNNVTLQGNSFNGGSQLVQLTAGGLLPALNGSNLTNVNALTLQGFSPGNASGNLALNNGTLNANLNADLLDGLDSTAFATVSGSGNYIQNGTSPQTADFNVTGNGTIGGTATANLFSGSGASLTNLNASNLASGTIASARISGSYTGITGTGALTVGSIAAGFGTIATANTIQGSQLISTVATGTAPLSVASTTKVTNLNADLLDGLDSTAFATASGSGNYIQNGTTLQTANFNISGNGFFGGDVGIGTTTPGARLSVQDSSALKLELKNGSGGTVGQLRTDNINNIGVGYNALANNTVTGTGAEGLYNSAFGSYALQFNTTGNYNTASGRGALNANTTGNTNTASGVQALYSNTTGIYNTANGVNSLYANTTGNYNTASGVNSLRFNTTGNYNTANGYAALYSNTTGINNTANGYAALYSNTTGINNTANGYAALVFNTTGINNTANGYAALYSNTTGTSNLALGVNSGRINTTGSNNTFIGTNAGFTGSSDGLTNATAIGYNTQVTASNSLILGNGANVGIGTTSPAYKLDVQGGTGIVGQFSGRVIGGNALNTNEFATLGQVNSAASGGNFIQNGTALQTANFNISGNGYFGGNVGIGTTSPTNKLELAASTSATGGIGFGTDTNLYRSAADTLKTDDSFVVGANLNVSGASTLASLTVSGAATFQGALTVAGNATFNGDITFSANTRGKNEAVASSATTLVISGKTYPDASYAVNCTPNYNTTCFVTAKSATGFTLNFGTTAPAAATVDWIVIR